MTFEPFSVQCLTCGSRLRVSDPSVVGTIASCPRCHSMVQIQPPGTQVAVGAPSVDSQAITEDAIAAPDDTPSNQHSAPPAGFAGVESLDHSEEALPADPTIPPDWQSRRTHKSRQVALVVAVAVTGLLTAVLFFGWFVRKWSPQSTEVAVDTEAETAAGPADPAQQSEQATDSPPSDDLGSEPPAAESDPANSNQPATLPPEGNRDADPDADSPKEDEPPPNSPLVMRPAEADPDQGNEDNAVPPLDPSGLDAFKDILLQAGPIDLVPTEDAPPTLDDIDIEAPAANRLDPQLIGKPLPKINLKADLAIKVALDTKGYRLGDLLLLFSQLTGVPIQADWVSLDLMGIDIHQNVHPPTGKFLSVQDLLNQVAESIQCEIRVEPHLIVLTPTDDAFEKRLRELTDLADFGEGRASAIETLNDFLATEPAQPSPELRIGPTRDDQHFAILAVDSLRRMRGLEPLVAEP
ncbi:MAG: hypothetical protein MI861_16875, partial [Pirellulales bacterium]|nr:hypothetical protein [Pirellulales bacterium]